MTSQPFTPHQPRRPYLIGKARPNAIIGKNRETGEIALIVLGAFLGMMCGLLIPYLPLRIIGLTGWPAIAFAAVYMPYKRRTFYRWFEINRSFRRTLRNTPTYRSSAMEAGTSLDGREVEIGPPPGIGRVSWLSAPFGPDEIAVLLHVDRRTVTAAIEIEGPGVGLRDSEDQEALVERFGTLLKHVANGDGFVTRLQMLARTLPADPDAHAKDVAQRGDDKAPAWLQLTNGWPETWHLVDTHPTYRPGTTSPVKLCGPRFKQYRAYSPDKTANGQGVRCVLGPTGVWSPCWRCCRPSTRQGMVS